MYKQERIKIGKRFLDLSNLEIAIIGDHGLDQHDPDDVTLVFINSQKSFKGDEAAAIIAYLERTSINLEELPENDNPHMAKTCGEQVTPRQKVAIRAIANAAKIDAEAECLELYQCSPDELSRKAASAFIDHLKTQKGKATAMAG